MDQETLNKESSRALQPLRQPGPLPSEILAEILFLSLPPLPERQAPQIKLLSLVCRFWHLVVDSTPALWSRISIKDNISHVQKVISKSGEHPIDVCGEGMPARDWWTAIDPHDSSKFVAQVQPLGRRWRHVMLRVPPHRGSTPAFTILPSLQTLDLYSWESLAPSDQLLALLNRQHAPFLREISLRGLRIASLHLISFPPTLSKLEISRMKVDYPLIFGWLSIIAACPNLAVLRLYNVSTTPGHGVKVDENNAPAVVELSRLRELDLDLVHSGLILDILMRLRLPEACAISIRCELQSPNPSTSFLIPALSNQSNFQHAGNARQVTITLTGNLQGVLVVYQLWRVNLYLPGTQAILNALDWLGIRGEDSNASSSHPGSLRAGLATSSDPPITLKLDRNWLRRHFNQLCAISDLRNVNRIEMDFLSDQERRAFLFHLSTPEDPKQPRRMMADLFQTQEPESNQGVAGLWLFPALSELVRRDFKSNVVYRVLVEPMTGQCSNDAAAGTSGRARRSELAEPNTPWETVT